MTDSSSKLKISDYIRDRDKRNFGTCRKCEKKVYWSTCKVVSHIRSGHCPEATDEEVKKFKRDYVYGTPKHLVHRMSSSAKNDHKSSSGTKSYRKLIHFEQTTLGSKKRKVDSTDDSEPENDEKEEVYEEFNADAACDENDVQFLVIQESQTLSDGSANEVKKEEVYERNLSNRNATKISRIESVESVLSSSYTPPMPILVETQSVTTMSKEDKFIDAVYPHYSSKSRLQLIEEILEIKRQNDLLLSKCKNYEETIHRLLN